MHGGIAAVAAHVKGHAAGRVGADGAALHGHVAVVVGQRVRGGVACVVQRQRHALQGQVAVVLNQEQGLLGIDGTILEGDLVVLQQLEGLALGSGAADQLAVHRVGVAVEVHRQAGGGKLALRSNDAVAGAVLQQLDRLAVIGRCNRSLQAGIADLADLGHSLGDDPPLAILHRALLRHDVAGSGLLAVAASGDEGADALVSLVHLAGEVAAGDGDGQIALGVALGIGDVQGGRAGDGAAADADLNVQLGGVLGDGDAGAAGGGAAAVGVSGGRIGTAGDGAAGHVQLARADLDAGAGAGDSRAVLDVDGGRAVEGDAHVVAADLGAAVHVDHGVAGGDVAHDPDHAVHGAVDVNGVAVAGVVGALVQDDAIVGIDDGVGGKGQLAGLALGQAVDVDRAGQRAALQRQVVVISVDAAGQGLAVEIQGDLLAALERQVLGHAAQQLHGVAVLGGREGIGHGGVERSGPLVLRHSPEGLQRQVGGDRSLEVIGLAIQEPAAEHGVVLGRVSGSGRFVAVIHGLRSDCAAAARVKAHGVVLDLPLGLDGQVLGGHGGGHCGIPTGEGVAGLGGIRGSRHSRAIILGGLGKLCLAVHEGDGVLVDRPDGLDGQVLGGHGGGDLGIPTVEGVARLGGSRGSRHSRVVILGDGSDRSAAIGVKGDGVLVDLPLSGNGDVLGGHGGRHCGIPTGEGVAGLGGIRGSRHSRAVILGNRSDRGAASGVEGDGVLVDLPLSGEDHIVGGHGDHIVGSPAREGVALALGSTNEGGKSRAELDLLGDLVVKEFLVLHTVGVGDAVLVEDPGGLQSQVRGNGLCEVIDVVAVHPLVEGVAFPGGIGGLGDGFAVVDLDRGVCVAVVGVEGDGVDLDPVQVIDHGLAGHQSSGQRGLPELGLIQGPALASGVGIQGAERGSQRGDVVGLAVLHHRCLQHFAVAVGEDQHHILALPDRLENKVGVGHGGGDVFNAGVQALPALEVVVLAGRIGGLGDRLTEADVINDVFRAVALLIGNSVRVGDPGSRQRDIASNVLAEVIGLAAVHPLVEGVAFLGGNGFGRRDGLAVGNVHRIHLAAAVAVEAHGALGVHMVVVIYHDLLGPVAIRGVVAGNHRLEVAAGDIDLLRSRLLQLVLHHELAVEGTARDGQSRLVLRGDAAPHVVFDVAVDDSAVDDPHSGAVGIVVGHAHVEGHSVCSLCRDGGAAADQDVAVVVGQDIAAAALKGDILQSQIAVVLNQHDRLVRGDLAVLHGDLAALLKVEGLALCSGAAHQTSVDGVGVSAEVDGDLLGLGRGDHHAVAGAILQQFDLVAVLGRGHSLGQRLKLQSGLASDDSGHIVLGNDLVRIGVLGLFIRVVNVLVVRMEVVNPTATIGLSLVFIGQA